MRTDDEAVVRGKLQERSSDEKVAISFFFDF